MSTILKALKKLEQDKEAAGAGGLPAGYMGPGSSHLQPSRSAGHRFGMPARRGLMLLFVLLIGGVVFFYYRSVQLDPGMAPTPSITRNQPPHPSIPKAAARPPGIASRRMPPRPAAGPETALPAETATPKVHLSPKPVPAAEMSPGTANAAKTPEIPAVSVRPTIEGLPESGEIPQQMPEPPTPPGRMGKRPRQRPETAVGTAVARPQPDAEASSSNPAPASPTGRSAAETAVAPPASSSPKGYDRAAPLTDGRLHVQAIAWSSTVEDRMAVVNNHIVHEGDNVDGFVVISIRRDDVVVRENGTSYRVEFGRP